MATPDERDSIATEIVLEYLDDGIEYISVVEHAVDFEYELDEEELRDVHRRATELLNNLYENL